MFLVPSINNNIISLIAVTVGDFLVLSASKKHP